MMVMMICFKFGRSEIVYPVQHNVFTCNGDAEKFYKSRDSTEGHRACKIL